MIEKDDQHIMIANEIDQKGGHGKSIKRVRAIAYN